MLTITDATREIIKQDDIAFQALRAGYLNLSAYAEQILSLVEEKTLKEIAKGSVVVALSRIATEVDATVPLKPDLEVNDLLIKSPLCDISYEKTAQTQKELSDLYQVLDISDSQTLSITQGLTEISLIASEDLKKQILNHFEARPKNIAMDQVGLTVKFSDKYLPVPNVLYTLQAALAVHRVNFTEIISTYTEFTFILESHYLETAMSALQKFLR